MRFSRVLFIFSIVAPYLLIEASAQGYVGLLDREKIHDRDVEKLNTEFGYNKKLPEGFEIQALLALSYYPELKNVKVKFIERKRGGPFVSRPTVWSTFFRGARKRTHKIFFRSNSHAFFNPILMKNMPFNAQVGVFGHELGHTTDFINRGVGKMINVILGNLSRRYMDGFEFETDQRAIAHGLGLQILAWSDHASKTLRVNEPDNHDSDKKVDGIVKRERYMRPGSIIAEMKEIGIYESFFRQDGTFKNISSN